MRGKAHSSQMEKCFDLLALILAFMTFRFLPENWIQFLKQMMMAAITNNIQAFSESMKLTFN